MMRVRFSLLCLGVLAILVTPAAAQTPPPPDPSQVQSATFTELQVQVAEKVRLRVDLQEAQTEVVRLRAEIAKLKPPAKDAKGSESKPVVKGDPTEPSKELSHSAPADKPAEPKP